MTPTLRERVAIALWNNDFNVPWTDAAEDEADQYLQMADVAIRTINDVIQEGHDS